MTRSVLDPTTADVRVDDRGTIVLLWAQTCAAYRWLARHVMADAMWLSAGGSRALVMEPRYVSAVVTGLSDDGFTVA